MRVAPRAPLSVDARWWRLSQGIARGVRSRLTESAATSEGDDGAAGDILRWERSVSYVSTTSTVVPHPSKQYTCYITKHEACGGLPTRSY